MPPGSYAAETPDKVAAVLVETAESLTYGELEDRSVRLAQVRRDAGLRRSGTTGRPKGVRPPLPRVRITEQGDPLLGLVNHVFGVARDTAYLGPAPRVPRGAACAGAGRCTPRRPR